MTDPVRWKEPESDATPALRAVVRYARSRSPDAAQLAALTNAVLTELALPLAPALGAAAKSKGMLGLGATKLVTLGLGTLLLAGSVALRYHALPSAGEPEQREAPSPALAPPPRAPQTPPSEPVPIAPESPAALRPSTQLVTRPAVRTPRAQPAKPDLTRELSLLQAARAERAHSVEAALGLLREHEQNFPESVFREEREALWIELLQRHDPARAGARLREFEVRYPDSAYRGQLGQPGGAQQ